MTVGRVEVVRVGGRCLDAPDRLRLEAGPVGAVAVYASATAIDNARVAAGLLEHVERQAWRPVGDHAASAFSSESRRWRPGDARAGP